jgi:hypothetical protein
MERHGEEIRGVIFGKKAASLAAIVTVPHALFGNGYSKENGWKWRKARVTKSR